MINVTKAYLPSKSKYQDYIDKIFQTGWLTNNGQLLKTLERRLAKHLGVKHLICVANGSLALQLAYKALDLKGEVITTPFSFVATASTLSWEGLIPIFADIDPNSFNITPANIEPLITDKTSAILPVHVFGNPCQVEAIGAMADKHNLNVVYDAAHAFDTRYTDKAGHSQSVLNYGNISTISFHATKLFHTIEGGAVITNDDDLAEKIRTLINFGITGPTSIEGLGTNAKMNEFEAAMGLCLLDDIDYIKTERKRIWDNYHDEFIGLLELQNWNPQSLNNHAYAPVVFSSETDLLRAERVLNENNIMPRRYFYPSLDTLNYLNPTNAENILSGSSENTTCPNVGKRSKQHQFCENSRCIASRILCLPIYPGLKKCEQRKVIDIIKGCLDE